MQPDTNHKVPWAGGGVPTIAKVCGAKTEEHGDRAAKSTFVLDEIGAVFWARRCGRAADTTAADQLRWVVLCIPGSSACILKHVGAESGGGGGGGGGRGEGGA